MNEFEASLAALLDRAAGEPPVTLSADEMITRSKRPHRYLAPALVAIVVAVIAVAVAIRTDVRGARRPEAHTTTTPAGPSNPRLAAMLRINAALASAPLPPGAQRAAHALIAGGITTSGSPNEVRVTGWWTAPGDVISIAQYVATHPPTNMTLDSNGSGSTSQFYDFTSGSRGQQRLEVDYEIASYGSGVAIQIDAWTVWAAIRPQWSYVLSTVTTADVSIIRLSRVKGSTLLGAPTVQRTLTGEAARRLAAALDALPAVAPEGVHSCPLPPIEASDRVLFNTPSGGIQITRYGGGCTFDATVTDTRTPARTTIIDGGSFDAALLSALGLPTNYGYSR